MQLIFTLSWICTIAERFYRNTFLNFECFVEAVESYIIVQFINKLGQNESYFIFEILIRWLSMKFRLILRDCHF